MKRALIAVLALAPSAFTRSIAQSTAAFPAEPPALGAPRRFVAPTIHGRRLPNGLATALVPFGSAPLTYIQLTIGVGQSSHLAERPGVASIATAYLREGTRSFDRRALDHATSTLGLLDGDVQISAGDAEIVISGRVLADSAEGLLRLIASLVREPTFPPEALDRLKRDEARRARARATQAEVRALATADSLIFGDAAPRRATESTVARIELDDVRRFWSRYVGPRNTALYVAGVFDREAMMRAIEHAFGDWTGGPASPRPARQLEEARADSGTPRIHLIDRPGASQARVLVAYPVPDPGTPDYFALNELNVVMGSVQTSRIIHNVRESHGYSYNISSRLYARPAVSSWVVSGDVVNASAGPALREVLGEIGRIRDTALMATELRGFQTFMAGVLVSENSTPDGIVSTLAWLRLFGVDPAYLGSFVERVYEVTPAQIQAVARRYLDRSRATIVVVGDRKAVEGQLADLAPIVVLRQ